MTKMHPRYDFNPCLFLRYRTFSHLRLPKIPWHQSLLNITRQMSVCIIACIAAQMPIFQTYFQFYRFADRSSTWVRGPWAIHQSPFWWRTPPDCSSWSVNMAGGTTLWRQVSGWWALRFISVHGLRKGLVSDASKVNHPHVVNRILLAKQKNLGYLCNVLMY